MSYVSQQFLLADNSSTANFKNWAQAISTAFSSAGWTQTSDTGQVNWSTVTVPASASFVYEIWQPADALQTGSTKFYLKVRYGTGSGSPAGPRIQIQVGLGTDGAGTLTGFTSTNFEFTNTAGAGKGSVLTYDCYFSGDTDRFSFMLWRSLASLFTCGFSIERTRDTAGADSSDGVTIVSFAPSNTPGQQTLVFGVGVGEQTPTAFYVSLTSYNSGSGAFNNNVPISPCFPVYGKYGNPLTTIGFVRTADVAEGCIFTTTLYGSTRTYIATNSGIALSGPTFSRYCMRYD